MPHNVELEMALLGQLLYEDARFLEVDPLVSGADFYEPFHQRLFKAIGDLVKVGRRADPIILADWFVIDPAFHELGGLRYLADLVDRSPPAAHAADYAKAIRDLAIRRDVIAVAKEVDIRAREDAEASGADLMAYMESGLIHIRSGKEELTLRDFGDVAHEVVYGMDRPDDRPLVMTGLKRIDEPLGGLERGDLVVIGARPSMGKSALASCIALNAALEGKGVIELNGEMTTLQMARRHLTDYAFTRFGDLGPMYRDIRRKNLTESQKSILRNVQEELAHLPLKMLKRTGMTLGRIRALLRRQKMLWAVAGVDLTMVVVDHVGLVHADEDTRGRVEAQTLISGGLKAMAEELDVVMIALAQLNRKVEDRDDKRPQLSDLRDSGSWEQDADIVLGVYRDAYYARREREPKSDLKMAEWLARCGSREVEAIMLKIREGDVGTAKLWTDIGRNAIRDYAPADATFI